MPLRTLIAWLEKWSLEAFGASVQHDRHMKKVTDIATAASLDISKQKRGMDLVFIAHRILSLSLFRELQSARHDPEGTSLLKKGKGGTCPPM